MTDLAIPAAHNEMLDSVRNEQIMAPSIPIDGLEPAELAAVVKSHGLEVPEMPFAWKAAGARALLLSALGREFLIENRGEQPCLVTRLHELPEKTRKVGPYIVLPIDRCEAEVGEVIVPGQPLVLHGLCRATKKLDTDDVRGFSIGPVQAARYLP